MNRISRNISIVIRSERLIAQRRFAVLRRQTGLMAAAGVVAGIGLIMLNVAAYLALATRVSPALAALIVALVNFAVAAIFMSVAGKANAEAEVAGVTELRDMAMEDLETEISGAASEVKEAARSLRNMARNPLGTAAPGLLGALLGAVLKNLKK